MDAFSELDMGSPVTSTVTDLQATVEGALDYDPLEALLGERTDFFDAFHKEGYEGSLPPAYPGPSSPSPPSTFSLLQGGHRKNDGHRARKRSASSEDGYPDSNSGKSFAECRVCGDKASGYHYGVTSCEGCKGFFRRSIQKQIDYKCLRDKQCVVIRLNRNRCQYCRFRKCLDVGMSKDSVRYGRVPKRSREKSQDIHTGIRRKEVAMYDMILSIQEAHLAHCAYTQERTQGLVRKPALFQGINDQQGAAVQKLVLWQQFASMLSPSIPHVVEFAKRIPSFHDLLQDDQLRCIKYGFFEVWLLQASRLSNESSLTFADGTCISRQHLEVMFDQNFVAMIFNFVCWFNDLRLSDCEIALFSAIVLVTPERDGVCGHKALQQLQEQLLKALQQQVAEEHPGEPHVFPTLVSKLPEIRLLGHKHLEHLQWFRSNWMHLRLSPLFAEVFDIPQHEAQR